MLPTTASLIEQSWWWLVPYAALMLLMLYAMMEFTVTLLQRRLRRLVGCLGFAGLGLEWLSGLVATLAPEALTIQWL